MLCAPEFRGGRRAGTLVGVDSYVPNRRLTGPADQELNAAGWHRWVVWSGALADTFGWQPFTAADAVRLNLIHHGFEFSGPELEQVVFRNMVGVPIEGRMMAATKNPRVWRLWHSSSDRPSAEFDWNMYRTYGQEFGWPELWANRRHTPFGGLGPDDFLGMWQVWAQVGSCRCGRFGAHHVTVHGDADAGDRVWRIAPAPCREMPEHLVPLVEDLLSTFGRGVPFTSADLVESGLDSVQRLHSGLDVRSERWVGRRLAEWADSVPPGERAWFPVRLGEQSGSNRMSFAVVSWGTPPPVVV